MRTPSDRELRSIYDGLSISSPFERRPAIGEAILYDFEAADGRTYCVASSAEVPEGLGHLSERTDEIVEAIKASKVAR